MDIERKKIEVLEEPHMKLVVLRRYASFNTAPRSPQPPQTSIRFAAGIAAVWLWRGGGISPRQRASDQKPVLKDSTRTSPKRRPPFVPPYTSSESLPSHTAVWLCLASGTACGRGSSVGQAHRRREAALSPSKS